MKAVLIHFPLEENQTQTQSLTQNHRTAVPAGDSWPPGDSDGACCKDISLKVALERRRGFQGGDMWMENGIGPDE